jgi:hypothetical protein
MHENQKKDPLTGGSGWNASSREARGIGDPRSWLSEEEGSRDSSMKDPPVAGRVVVSYS